MVEETDTAVTLPVLGAWTYREIHAFEEGIYHGYEGESYSDVEPRYRQESHYWKVGYLAGNLLLKRLRENQ